MRSDRTRARDACAGGDGGRVALPSSGHADSDAKVPDLHIRVLSSDGRTIVHVSGELDAHTAARLRNVLAGLITGGARRIVVDLGDVSLMGASGLGVLVGASKRLQQKDGKLLLRSAPPSVQKLIEITALDATLRQT